MGHAKELVRGNTGPDMTGFGGRDEGAGFFGI